jgi:hypothetical protein
VSVVSFFFTLKFISIDGEDLCLLYLSFMSEFEPDVSCYFIKRLHSTFPFTFTITITITITITEDRVPYAVPGNTFTKRAILSWRSPDRVALTIYESDFRRQGSSLTKQSPNNKLFLLPFEST